MRNVQERKDGEVGGQERQWCEIVWALRQPEEKEVETWAILYEAFASRDEVGVVAAGVEEASALGYTIIDRA